MSKTYIIASLVALILMLEETWFHKLSELYYHKENLSVNVTLEEEGSELL